MRRRRLLFVLPGLVTGRLALAAPAPATALQVHFIDPEHYTDAGYTSWPASARDLADVERDLRRHLEGLAARHLAADESMVIDVLDIDLAGQTEPMLRAGREIRVVRGVTWPRLKLRYAVSRGGQPVMQGEERLNDMGFQMSFNRYPDGERLRYEKAMLDDWFERVFAKEK